MFQFLAVQQEKTVDSVLSVFAKTLDDLNEVYINQQNQAEDKADAASELLAEAKAHEVEAKRANAALKRFGALLGDIAPNALPL